MISIGKVNSSGYGKHVQDAGENGAAEYYAGEDVPSQWAGSLAAQQGRAGEVSKDDLVDALQGRITDASGERVMSDERSNWTAAYDVTVSAPKSVSMEAVVHGNQDAMDAHREAVQAVMDKLEAGIGTRVTSGGKTEHEHTGNAQIAQFEHHMSASGDPHLHTHNVVSNATMSEDGNARAIDAKESIYGQVSEMNKTYNEALEKGLNDRGIATYKDANGQTQIEGYDKEGMRAFSARQDAMDKALQERGSSYDAAGQKERELARQETRKDVERGEMKTRDEAKAGWQEKADQARESGAKVGPAERAQERDKPGTGEETGRAATAEKSSYSREEFREAKFTVNEGKAAEQRLESGNFRNGDHKQDLEQRVQKMEDLKRDQPDLYDRAEKAVEKMGVRDNDKKVDDAAMRAAQREASAAADRAASELNTAKWTVGKGKDAQEQLDSGRVKGDAHREQLQDRVNKAEQLKEQKPELHAKAEQAWNQEFREAKHLARSEKDADQRLPRGNFFSEQHKEDLQALKAAAQDMRDKQPAMMAMADRAVERESRGKEPEKKAGADNQQADRKEASRDAKGAGKAQDSERAKDGGKSAKAKPEKDGAGGDWKAQFKENINTLKDADLAARALKSDAGLAAGFFKKELSAKDRESMTRVYNSKGDLFYQDKKGNVYSSLLNGKEPGSFKKEQESLFGMGKKEFLVTEKGDVFVRGNGFAGGVAQKFADSLKSDGKGLMARTWNNTVQDAIGAKWEKATGKDAEKALKEANAARKDYYDSRIELRHALQQDVKNAVAAITERPKEMAKAYDRLKADGKDLQIDKKAKQDLENARAELKAKQGRPEKKDDAAKVASGAMSAVEKGAQAIAAISDKAKDPEQSKREAEKATAEKNEREATAAGLRASGADIRTSEKVAAELQKVSGGQRQEVEKELKEAMATGKAKDGKEASELVKQKIEETSGRATVDAQQREKLEKAADKGGKSSNMNDVYEGAAAKKELTEKDKESAAKQREAESATMRAIVEKYGSPDQRREYDGLDKAAKDAYKTAEEKEKQDKQEHKAIWGY